MRYTRKGIAGDVIGVIRARKSGKWPKAFPWRNLHIVVAAIVGKEY